MGAQQVYIDLTGEGFYGFIPMPPPSCASSTRPSTGTVRPSGSSPTAGASSMRRSPGRLPGPGRREGADRAAKAMAVLRADDLNIQRRIADNHFVSAKRWHELALAHDRWREDYNAQRHWTHRDRERPLQPGGGPGLLHRPAALPRGGPPPRLLLDPPRAGAQRFGVGPVPGLNALWGRKPRRGGRWPSGCSRGPHPRIRRRDALRVRCRSRLRVPDRVSRLVETFGPGHASPRLALSSLRRRSSFYEEVHVECPSTKRRSPQVSEAATVRRLRRYVCSGDTL